MIKTLLVYSVLYWLFINYNIIKTECVTFYVDGYLQRLALRTNSQVPMRVILLVYQSLLYLISKLIWYCTVDAVFNIQNNF